MNRPHPPSFDDLFAWLMARPGRLALLLGLLGSAAVMTVYMQLIQPWPCTGWGDCVKYTEMTRAFQRGVFHPVDYPFNIRVLSPWLASLLSDDVVQGFSWLTFSSFLLFVGTWFLLARQLRFPLLAYGFLIVWFALHPLGFRMHFGSRVLVDPAVYALMALAMYLYLARRHAGFFACVFVSLFFKESFMLVLLVALLTEAHEWARHHRDTKRLLGFAAAAVLVHAAYKIALYVGQPFPQKNIGTGDTSVTATLMHWGGNAWRDPALLVVWLGAFFSVTGALGVLALPALLRSRHERHPAAALSRESVFLGLGAAGYLCLGLVGGLDMSRILFNGILFLHAAAIHAAGGLARTRFALAAMALSLVVGLGYAAFFPGQFEYGYYTNGGSVAPSLAFVAAMLGLHAALWKLRSRLARQ